MTDVEMLKIVLFLVAVVFLMQMYKVYLHVHTNRKIDKFLKWANGFMKRQGLVNDKVLSLAGSLALQSGRTLNKVEKTVEQGVKDASTESTRVSEMAADLATTNKEKLDRLEQTGGEIHSLVNKAHGDTLRLSAVQAERIFSMTGLDTDKEALDLAKKLLKEHECRQMGFEKKTPSDSGGKIPVVPKDLDNSSP